MRLTTALFPALLLAGACTYHGTPVPVVGDTRALAGEWEGTYSGDRTGRSGSIQFHLKAGTDSAWGDVLMIPERSEQAHAPTSPQFPEWRGRPPRLLRISFVRCEEGKVTGWLEPYQDPNTGETIRTMFEGSLRNDEFRGSFWSAYPGETYVLSGSWSVKRRNEP
jgi:hypothetical protein